LTVARPSKVEITKFDRAVASVFPKYGVSRIHAKSAISDMQRHFEAASPGARTSMWPRDYRDADLTLRAASRELRNHSRDLLRNNGFAKRGGQVIAGGVVGTGIFPKSDNAVAMDLWRKWARTTECESDGRMHFNAMLYQGVSSGLYGDGEYFLRRRWRRASDGLTVPMQIQVLEADYLNTAMNELAGKTKAGGPIIQGIEFDKLGRRAAYWMWPQHPGSGRGVDPPTRIDASEIIHVYEPTRPGQTRGVSWLAAAILDLKDLDEFEDAELVRQKIAACFAAFVSDTDGYATMIGETPNDANDDSIEQIEPGSIKYLEGGKQIMFANPPSVTDAALAQRTLRRVAVGLGVTYEDFTGDYSMVNYSSARMARIAMQANFNHWQSDLVIPIACQGVWDWMCEAAQYAGMLPEDQPLPSVSWIAPSLPMLEPDKEALGNMRRVRGLMASPSQISREQGRDFDELVTEMKQGPREARRRRHHH
jgi:lambda family phage portal protein